MEPVAQDASEVPHAPRFGWIDEDGYFFFLPGKSHRFFTHFKDFYINYIQAQASGSRQQQIISEDGQTPPKPMISSKTSKIAEQRRKKILGAEGEGKKVDIVTILLKPSGT